MNKMPEICMIFARFFFLGGGAIPGSEAEPKRIRPQNHGGHRSTGAIVLNKLFMRLHMLLYSISLDANMAVTL